VEQDGERLRERAFEVSIKLLISICWRPWLALGVAISRSIPYLTGQQGFLKNLTSDLKISNCHDITMRSYQTMAEPLTQQLISKVLYRQPLHRNLLNFLVINLYQYKTLTSELH
jgi:hypothetical protein